MATQIKLRRDTAQNWSNANPILALGEPGIETDTNKFKFGDGVTRWANLTYVGSEFATTSYVTTTVNNLIGNAPAALNTLQELASAINTDPNFFSTISSSLANKADTSYVDSAIANINLPSTAGLASESYVNSAINNIQLPNLDPYATTTYVDSRISNIEIPSVTGLASESYVDTAISNLVNGAPNALNTLNELANALGNDSSFTTNITNLLANKADISSLGNIVTVNLDGNTANILYGNGVFAAAPAGGLGGASTGNITFDNIKIIGSGNASGDGYNNGTIELVPDANLYNNDQYLIIDPTAPNHIHIRAGGTQDNSNSLLFLGGEKHNFSVQNNGGIVRMQTENLSTINQYYLNTSSGYSTAVWSTDASNTHSIVFNDPTQEVYNAVWALNSESLIELYDGSSYTTVTNTGSSTPGMPSPVTLYVNTAPPSNPTNLNQVFIEIRETGASYIQVDGTDIRMEAQDDVRIYSKDAFRFYNRSAESPIQFYTDYTGAAHQWQFTANGTFMFPDSTIQSTAWTLYLLEAYANVTYTLPDSFTEDVCRYSVVNNTVNVSSNWFDTSTYTFTPQKSGYWEITAAYDVYRNSEASMSIKKNNNIVASAGSFGAVAQQVTKIIFLNGSTDYINIFNYGGAALSRSQYAERSWFQARWVGE